MAIQNQRMQKLQQQQTQQQQQQQQKEGVQKRDLTPPQAPPMTAATSATNATASAANGGPRVSFNRDVHVKRIGKRPNESTNYETTNLQPPQHPLPAYHQLPADLSAESIRKEAALVLAQAERHKSKAENGDNIPIFKVKTKRSDSSTATPNKFHSLPTRKKKAPGKPVVRSVSDATEKKPSKRPSIFNIFSRKSDTNVNQVDRDPRFEDSGGRRLVRSKSDVGSNSKPVKRSLKDSKQQLANGSAKQLPPTQLAPIIEQVQKEDYFEEQFNRERRKSEAITDREKHESGLDELLERSRHQAEVDGSLLSRHQAEVDGNLLCRHLAEVDGRLLGRNPISNNIKHKILTLQAKSQENMHSSQLPAQKLPLTKGVTVNGMVKRLSMERFSPPPIITGPAFSYTRPNEGITYAQLDLTDDQQQHHMHNRREYLRSPTREIRTPVRELRTPIRDIRSTERVLTRPAEDYTDFVTSQQQNQYHSKTNYNNGRNSFSPVAGPTTIHISSSHSPSPWQQLSPRNLSDEDEGLGFETRKYFEDEFSSKLRSKSPPEPPIIPVIRSITPPRDNGYDHGPSNRNGVGREDPVDDMGYRRARLESRILTRRFGDNTLERRHPHADSPARNREEHKTPQHTTSSRHRYLTPEHDDTGKRYHKPQTTEILQKYSPERSHLDIISPTSSVLVSTLPKTETKTSRYRHTKYFDDGLGGVKEVYERETRLDENGQPLVRESRHRERVDSFKGKQDHSPTERQHLADYEPKSLDSQFTNTDQYRSSPENMKRYEVGANGVERGGYQLHASNEDHWQSSLKRDKLQQRSFDKGDSGIENDFRKESFNGDLTSRWRKRTYIDDMRVCEAFLKKERRHTEQMQAATTGHRNETNYVYRERSIDDGSHFDPHLDKYPTATSTLRRSTNDSSKERQTQSNGNSQGQETLKRNKKIGGFEKVKQLFTGGGSGGGSGSGSSAHSSSKKQQEQVEHIRANSTTSSVQTLPKDKYMVKEEEMRSRYREHRGHLQNELREPKMTDISMRRRLSTPKASPLLIKRTSSEKKQSPLVKKNSSEKPEKMSWFKSLDRRSKSKSKEKLNVSVNGQHETSSMKRSKQQRSTAAPPIPAKNLRFFGDTDLDSNPPTISRATTTPKTRPSVSSTLNRSQKYSQSAHHLDRINDSPQQHVSTQPMPSYMHNSSVATSRHKSTSMQNLENGGTDEVDFRKRRHYSRSRDLDDISESGSETEEKHKRQNGLNGNVASRSLSRERLDRAHRYDDHAYRRSNDRQTTPTSSMTNGDSSTLRRQHQHLIAPPKPARSAERRVTSSYSRERDRYPAESSGTEGESSLHSQRSVVYLHATTVGAIPQPYQLRRRSISREDLRTQKTKNQPLPPIQPMTRTVSRSVSMLAPWKPKLISEGYEINYSQEQNQRMSTLPRKQQQQQHLNGSSSTLTRPIKKTEAPSSRSRRHDLMKDDQSSLRNSSTTSASKSALSSNLRADAKRKIK